jgi:hypothetical protein
MNTIEDILADPPAATGYFTVREHPTEAASAPRRSFGMVRIASLSTGGMHRARRQRLPREISCGNGQRTRGNRVPDSKRRASCWRGLKPATRPRPTLITFAHFALGPDRRRTARACRARGRDLVVRRRLHVGYVEDLRHLGVQLVDDGARASPPGRTSCWRQAVKALRRSAVGKRCRGASRWSPRFLMRRIEVRNGARRGSKDEFTLPPTIGHRPAALYVRAKRPPPSG